MWLSYNTEIEYEHKKKVYASLPTIYLLYTNLPLKNAFTVAVSSAESWSATSKSELIFC